MPDKDLRDVLAIFDWGSMFILPKNITFKGDNAKYLKTYLLGRKYLQFRADYIADVLDRNEVFIAPDGSVHITSDHFGKFWRRDDDTWILTDSNDSTVASATGNFSKDNKLSEGRFDPIYKGILSTGQEIAVKRLAKKLGQVLDEFKNEGLC